MIAGPVIDAVGATFADFAIQTFSETSSYSSLSSFFPNSNINSFILGSTSQGYVAP